MISWNYLAAVPAMPTSTASVFSATYSSTQGDSYDFESTSNSGLDHVSAASNESGWTSFREEGSAGSTFINYTTFTASVLYSSTGWSSTIVNSSGTTQTSSSSLYSSDGGSPSSSTPPTTTNSSGSSASASASTASSSYTTIWTTSTSSSSYSIFTSATTTEEFDIYTSWTYSSTRTYLPTSFTSTSAGTTSTSSTTRSDVTTATASQSSSYPILVSTSQTGAAGLSNIGTAVLPAPGEVLWYATSGGPGLSLVSNLQSNTGVVSFAPSFASLAPSSISSQPSSSGSVTSPTTSTTTSTSTTNQYLGDGSGFSSETFTYTYQYTTTFSSSTSSASSGSQSGITVQAIDTGPTAVSTITIALTGATGSYTAVTSTDTYTAINSAGYGTLISSINSTGSSSSSSTSSETVTSNSGFTGTSSSSSISTYALLLQTNCGISFVANSFSILQKLPPLAYRLTPTSPMVAVIGLGGTIIPYGLANVHVDSVSGPLQSCPWQYPVTTWSDSNSISYTAIQSGLSLTITTASSVNSTSTARGTLITEWTGADSITSTSSYNYSGQTTGNPPTMTGLGIGSGAYEAESSSIPDSIVLWPGGYTGSGGTSLLTGFATLSRSGSDFVRQIAAATLNSEVGAGSSFVPCLVDSRTFYNQ